jgi:hypothetical protein
VDFNSQSRALREPNEPERLSAATGLIARPLFERSYCLPVLLNVNFHRVIISNRRFGFIA